RFYLQAFGKPPLASIFPGKLGSNCLPYLDLPFFRRPGLALPRNLHSGRASATRPELVWRPPNPSAPVRCPRNHDSNPKRWKTFLSAQSHLRVSLYENLVASLTGRTDRPG